MKRHDALRGRCRVGHRSRSHHGVPGKSSLIIAYDLPGPARLRELAAQGEVLLLLPPGTEAFAGRLAPNRRPLHARGLLEKAQSEVFATRRTITAALDRGPEPGSFHALAPLLERYEATAVAAALLELWTGARTGALPPEPLAFPAITRRSRSGSARQRAAVTTSTWWARWQEIGLARESVGLVSSRIRSR